MRIVRDIGSGNNSAHMTKTPAVERCLTPVGQRYLILRSRRKSRHECRHSYCPLCGMTRFVVRGGTLVAGVLLLWPDLLRGRPLVIYRAVLRRVQPAPALRCPQGAVCNIGTGAAAKDRGQHEGAADLPQIVCP